jgi:hypothetical protein
LLRTSNHTVRRITKHRISPGYAPEVTMSKIPVQTTDEAIPSAFHRTSGRSMAACGRNWLPLTIQIASIYLLFQKKTSTDILPTLKSVRDIGNISTTPSTISRTFE